MVTSTLAHDTYLQALGLLPQLDRMLAHQLLLDAVHVVFLIVQLCVVLLVNLWRILGRLEGHCVDSQGSMRRTCSSRNWCTLFCWRYSSSCVFSWCLRSMACACSSCCSRRNLYRNTKTNRSLNLIETMCVYISLYKYSHL